jgi:glutathione S-transferase
MPSTKRKAKSSDEAGDKKSKKEGKESKNEQEETKEETEESQRERLIKGKGGHGLSEPVTFRFRPKQSHKSIKGLSFPVKLEYFPMQALAEIIKLVFEEAQVPYDCQLASGDKYAEERHKSTPFGSVPVIRLKDAFPNTGGVLAQSHSILRFVAGKLGMDGKTPEERATVDMVYELSIDLKNGLAQLHAAEKGWEYQRLARVFQMAQSLLEKSGDAGYFHNLNKLTYGDLAMFHVLTIFETSKPGCLTDEFKVEKLNQFREKIAGRPNIAAYLSSGRRVPISYKELSLPGWEKRLHSGYEYYYGNEKDKQEK